MLLDILVKSLNSLFTGIVNTNFVPYPVLEDTLIVPFIKCKSFPVIQRPKPVPP